MVIMKENLLDSLSVQIKDFLETYDILPFGEITDRIVEITHPGESLHQIDVIDVLKSLQSNDDVELLLLHLLLNNIFQVDNFGMYDWGYWKDESGITHKIPYGSNKSVESYAICGLYPSINVLHCFYSEPSLSIVGKKLIRCIADYDEKIMEKATDDLMKWGQMRQVLYNGAREISKWIIIGV